MPLLLLDLVDLEAQQPAWDSRDMEECRAPFLLLPDPTVPERVFVRSVSAAWSLCLTWLPALSSWMSEGGSFIDLSQKRISPKASHVLYM